MISLWRFLNLFLNIGSMGLIFFTFVLAPTHFLLFLFFFKFDWCLTSAASISQSSCLSFTSNWYRRYRPWHQHEHSSLWDLCFLAVVGYVLGYFFVYLACSSSMNTCSFDLSASQFWAQSPVISSSSLDYNASCNLKISEDSSHKPSSTLPLSLLKVHWGQLGHCFAIQHSAIILCLEAYVYCGHLN